MEMEPSLPIREQMVLFAIVSHHIMTSQPVGSRTLCRESEWGLSPATIRNVMADLTEYGYLTQAHSSAGRVPSLKGYCLYADSVRYGYLKQEHTLAEADQEHIETALADAPEGLSVLLSICSRILFERTQLTAVSASPRASSVRWRKVVMNQLGSGQTYVALITLSNMTYQGIVESSEDIEQNTLDQLSEHLNSRFASHPVHMARSLVLENLAHEKSRYEHLLAQVARISKRTLEISTERELYVDGRGSILKNYDNMSALHRIIDALDDKVPIISALDSAIDQDGEILIDPIDLISKNGQDDENNMPCMLIAARYGAKEHYMGSIGVLGSLRIDYKHVIPIVAHTAKTLSKLLTQTPALSA